MMEDDEFLLTADIRDQIEARTGNPYMRDPVLAMELMARLLAAPDGSAGATTLLARLRGLVDEEFAGIAPWCGPAGVTAARELAGIVASIEESAMLPALANKVVVGVGGGFSAGKSRFLNSLLGIEILPEGPAPTTAIPTGLMGGDIASMVQNRLGAMVQVNQQELQALEHGFNREYQPGADDRFGFAHLLELIIVQEPSMRWANLVLLDTPGYDAPEGKPRALADEEIARRHLNQADHIVWLVNAHNGTLRLDDIQFLRSLRRRPVFFVVTHADTQNASALSRILRSVENAAMVAGIESLGIMAWAARQGMRRGAVEGGADIHQWLDTLNLKPKLMDKRRHAASLVEALGDYLREQSDAGREELTLLNAFWPVVQQVSEETADGIRRMLSARRESQRAFGARLMRLELFRRDLDAVLTETLAATSLADAQSPDDIERQYQDALLVLHAGNGFGADAFALLHDAACHDHVPAQFALSECYRLGTGTAADPILSLTWCTKAADAGLADAQCRLGDAYLDGDGVPAGGATALRWYFAAAEQEDVRAQMKLFACHAGALAGHEDVAVATSWLKRAAQQDYAEAQYELGKAYQAGRGVGKNRRTALSWLTKAGEQQYAPAQYAIGLIHLDDADETEAVKWFRLAAQQELPEAQAALGRCYLDGTGVTTNRAHAASWYRKAERLGHVPAITGLGHCHFAAEEAELGVRCYRRAADLGDGEAQFRLGECYQFGDGVRKNRSTATYWFEQADEQGYAQVHDPLAGKFA